MNTEHTTIAVPQDPREPWRFTYTFSNTELIEHIRAMRKNTFTSITFMLRREVLIQAQERGLITLPVTDRRAHV